MFPYHTSQVLSAKFVDLTQINFQEMRIDDSAFDKNSVDLQDSYCGCISIPVCLFQNQ